MTTKEILQALRLCSEIETGCAGCCFEECTAECVGRLMQETATRLEELETENKRLRNATANSDDWVDD